MHKLIFFFSLNTLGKITKGGILWCSILWLVTTIAFCKDTIETNAHKQPQSLSHKKVILPEKLTGNWKASGPIQVLSAEQCLVLPDGDIYSEYELQSLTSRFYTNGKSKLAVEVFQTRFASEAYGLYTFIMGLQTNNQIQFYRGPFLVRISLDFDKLPIDQSFIEELKTNIQSDSPDEENLPTLPSNLPKQDKIPGTERYLIGTQALARIKDFAELKDIINFAGGTQAVSANYRDADKILSLIIIEYHTPQLATDGYTSVQNYHAQLTAGEQNSRLLRRIGNYVIVANNVRNAQSADKIISQIQYAPKVYWEGKRLTDLPIQFRPPDPAAIEEASQTAKIIIRTFYWIGIMITGAIIAGLLIGGTIFYWKRYRKHKLGLDDMFSDAGGTVRLNLDDFLLQPGEPPIKGIVEKK